MARDAKITSKSTPAVAQAETRAAVREARALRRARWRWARRRRPGSLLRCVLGRGLGAACLGAGRVDTGLAMGSDTVSNCPS